MKKIQKLLLGLFVFGLCVIGFEHIKQVDVNAASYDASTATCGNYKLIGVSTGATSNGQVVLTVQGTSYTFEITYRTNDYNVTYTEGIPADGEWYEVGSYNVSWTLWSYKCITGSCSSCSHAPKDNAYNLCKGFLPNTGFLNAGSSWTIGEGSASFIVIANCTGGMYKNYRMCIGMGKAIYVDYAESAGYYFEYKLSVSDKVEYKIEGQSLSAGDVVTDVLCRGYTKMVYKHGTKASYNVYDSWYTAYSNVSETYGNYSKSPGVNNVPISYNVPNVGVKSTDTNITWRAKDITTINATYSGGKIIEGLAFPKDKVSILVTFNNGDTATIRGDNQAVSYSTSTVNAVGKNTITVKYSYKGHEQRERSDTIEIEGLPKDLVSITTKYIGDPIVEEMYIPEDKVEIVMSFNNNTKETYYAHSPKKSAYNASSGHVWINNAEGTTIYDTRNGKDDFLTTRWSVNNGSIIFTVNCEYYGTASNSASNTITVPVLKKTPISVDATYPENIEVVEGLPFDKADVTIAVTYDNGTVYTIDANGLEKSGYTNGYELDIKNTFLSSTDYDDYIGTDESIGDSWDIIVYNVGENRFVVYFTENEKTVIDDFIVIGVEKTAISIEATYHGPDITMGLAFLPGNVEIIVTYDNFTIGTLKGTAKSVTITNQEGVETTTVPNLGVNTYTAQFQECTDEFEVIGKEAVLTSIYVLQKPRRMFYTIEDAFDPTDMIVMATFSDYSEEMVQNSALDLSDGDSLRAGQEYVMIGYTVGGIRKETQTEVYVDIGSLSHITIEQEPNKLEYDPGEDFDPTGMVVLAHYSTGKSRVLGRTEYELIGAENLQSGQSSVTVRYTEDGIPVDAEQFITVRPKMLIDIEILKNPNKLNYFPGQNFSPAGMTVMAIYSDDSKKAITDSCTILDGTSLPLGKRTVTVSYTEVVGDNPITIMKTIDIVVADATVNNISAIYMGGKIKSGEAFSPSDVMITINYTNGEKQTVDGNYDGISFSSLIVKTVNNTVTVSYRGHTCVIKIPVLNDENNENQSITEIVSKSNWKEFFTVKKTRAVEDYYYSSGYKIPYIRKGIQTQKPLTMDIQFKLYAIEMGGWTTWYNSGEIVSTGNAPATGIKIGLLNAPDVTLSATINGRKYNNVDSSQEFLNPQTISFEMNGNDYFKLQYKASYNGKSTGWVDEGTVIGIPDIPIDGISFRIVKKK